MQLVATIAALNLHLSAQIGVQQEQDINSLFEQSSSLIAIFVDTILEFDIDMEASRYQHPALPYRLHSRRLLSNVVSAILSRRPWAINDHGIVKYASTCTSRLPGL